MKGKDTFTPAEIKRLRELIELKNHVQSSLPKSIRKEMRAIGFYCRDDWGIVNM